MDTQPAGAVETGAKTLSMEGPGVVLETRRDGLAFLIFDRPHDKVNLLSAPLVAVLEILVRNPGRLVSGKQILQQVWGPAYHTQTNYLRFYLAKLRQKLEPEPAHPRQLITEPGMGYRYQP